MAYFNGQKILFSPEVHISGYNRGWEEGYADGIDDGWEEGYEEGQEDGYNVGYGEGRDDGFDEGWDLGHDNGYSDAKRDYSEALRKCLTLDGERTNYSYAFARTNYDGLPAFDVPIKPTGAIDRMFYYYYGSNLPNIDLSRVPASANCQALFMGSKLGTIPDLGLRAMNGYWNVYANCADLVTITMLRVKETTTFRDATNGSKTFAGCTSLKNITIGGDDGDYGYIGQDIDFTACPLTKASLQNIINHLADRNGADTKPVLALGAANKTTVGSTYIDKAEAKGWKVT